MISKTRLLKNEARVKLWYGMQCSQKKYKKKDNRCKNCLWTYSL